jgi:Domain of unknown function (DUF1905)/Bacteriocin-protection, YdeI or OmpD-Associated
MMQEFKAIIKKFGAKGEKTSWTYFEIPADIAEEIAPNTRKSFRVKGFIDMHAIKQIATMPMGDGGFIIAINAAMRKGINKPVGAILNVKLILDTDAFTPDADLIACLIEDATAKKIFEAFTPGVQRYYHNWVGTAKTAPTKANKIATILSALNRGLNFSEMLREGKK